jgi:hypothetical protein
MSHPNLSRTGDDTLDRNFDEIRRHFRDVAVSGKIGPTITLRSGINLVNPAIPHPSARATVFLSPGTVTLTDVGLQADGRWQVNASAICTARFLWLE